MGGFAGIVDWTGIPTGALAVAPVPVLPTTGPTSGGIVHAWPDVIDKWHRRQQEELDLITVLVSEL